MVSNALMAFRLLAGLATLNFHISILWNFFYCIAACASYIVADSDCAELPYRSTYACGEILSFVFLSVALIGIENGVRELLQKELVAVNANRERCAVQDLLTTMTDAVVELDEDLRIVSHSQAFASMLLMAPHKTTAGMQFTHFACTDTDKQLIEERLLAPMGDDDAVSRARIFNV